MRKVLVDGQVLGMEAGCVARRSVVTRRVLVDERGGGDAGWVPSTCRANEGTKWSTRECWVTTSAQSSVVLVGYGLTLICQAVNRSCWCEPGL
jgi:hypothetical protein